MPEGFRAQRNKPLENKDASLRWWDEAACRDNVDYTKNKADKIEKKREICANCPVKEACLEDAMKYKDIFLFRAGKTPNELRAEYSSRGLKNL